MRAPRGYSRDTDRRWAAGVQDACELGRERGRLTSAGIAALSRDAVTHEELVVRGGAEEKSKGVAWVLGMVCVSF